MMTPTQRIHAVRLTADHVKAERDRTGESLMTCRERLERHRLREMVKVARTPTDFRLCLTGMMEFI